MLIVPSVMGCGGVRKYQVVGNIVLNNATNIEGVRIETREDRGRGRPQIAQDRYDRGSQNVVTKPPSVRPAAGNSSVTESCFDSTGQCISAEDAEAIKTGTSGQPRWAGRQIDFD
jgi:hypothetical protein